MPGDRRQEDSPAGAGVEGGTPVAVVGTPVAGLGTPVAVLGTPVVVVGTPVAGLGTPVAGLGTPAGSPVGGSRQGVEPSLMGRARQGAGHHRFEGRPGSGVAGRPPEKQRGRKMNKKFCYITH